MKSVRKTSKTTLYLPEDLHAELKIQAARLHTSMTELIEKAIRQELKRLAKQMKQN
jgi:predicted HicB family RNase H-like nuclease